MENDEFKKQDKYDFSHEKGSQNARERNPIKATTGTSKMCVPNELGWLAAFFCYGAQFRAPAAQRLDTFQMAENKTVWDSSA